MYGPLSFSLSHFIRTVGLESSKERKKLVQAIDGDLAYYSVNDRYWNSALLEENSNYQKCYSWILLIKTFWHLIPTKVFESCDPNYRKIAEEIFKEVSSEKVPEQTITSLEKCLKRLRSYYKEGREASSLDLSDPTHIKLLDQQNNRCEVCKYEFSDFDLKCADEIEGELLYDENIFGAFDIHLDRLNRKPVLDHIIPVFLGGDKSSNWQILCESCNSGKGETIGWVFRPSWTGIKKISDAFKLTPSMRYMILARDGKCTSQYCVCRNGTRELRISKRNRNKLIFPENLETRCIDCLQTNLYSS